MTKSKLKSHKKITLVVITNIARHNQYHCTFTIPFILIINHSSSPTTVILLLCSFTPYCYILGSGKEEVIIKNIILLVITNIAAHLPYHLFLLLVIVVVILPVLLLLCCFTPYCYILGSGKEEVMERGAGLLPDIYIYIVTKMTPVYYYSS